MSRIDARQLQLRIYNGATVADWLGTAANAAARANTAMSNVRFGIDADLKRLFEAEAALQQATQELSTVLARLRDEESL